MKFYGISFKNQEGYADPTAYQALTQIENEARKYQPLVYICSPFSGDIKGNTEKAKKYSRFAVDAGAIAFAPHLLLPLYMREDTERELAMFIDMVFLGKCDELWAFGDVISEGMQVEINKAKKKNMTIRYFTEDLVEA
ncbi:DUF4406 domain-containing protein [Clostridium sp. UBA7339]|uniref:DUF7768 domain-containing protein n=1 Tax=Clostridium sp. UBA7339 TaxID=1946376 RepID=UPI003217945A